MTNWLIGDICGFFCLRVRFSFVMRLIAVMLDCFSVYSVYYLFNYLWLEAEMCYYFSFSFSIYWIEVAKSIKSIVSWARCCYQLGTIIFSYRSFCIEMSLPSFYLRITIWLELRSLLTFLGAVSVKSIFIFSPHCSFRLSFVGFRMSSVTFCESYLGLYFCSSDIKLSNSYEPFPLPLS